ncbi:MAG: sulfate transporter [Thermoleophilia bacterium]|nr:sulfate transporter [Thermoleophilia bacterium]
MTRAPSSVIPRRGDYPPNLRAWVPDLVAGLTVGVVALPLAMGFGIASGVGAAAGLVTAVVAGFVAAIFGGSGFQVSGPTGAMTVVLVPAVAAHGVGAVPVLAVLAGIMVVLGGLLGAGRLVTLIPWPVIEGFTFGIATIIFLQQLPVLLDSRPPGGAGVLRGTFDVLRQADWAHAGAALSVAVGVAAVMLVGRRLRPSFPASLAAITIATVLVRALGIDVPTIGAIHPGSLVQVPEVPGAGHVADLLPAAATVALLAALESLLSARVADGLGDDHRVEPDRELFGQGLANVASGLAGGMPATGAIARTAVNVRAGARTRAAAAFHAVVLAALLVGASGLLARIPLAALAAVLMVTATHMVDVSTIRALLRAGRASALVFSITAATTLAVDLARAVEVGVLVAALLVLRTAAQGSGIEEEDDARISEHLDDSAVRRLQREHVVVYRLQGSLFFGAAQHFLEELAALERARVVVLRLGALHVLDVTGAQVLAETVGDFSRRGVAVLVCGARPQHGRVLAAVGIPGERVPPDRCFGDLGLALDRARVLASAATAPAVAEAAAEQQDEDEDDQQDAHGCSVDE